MEEATRDTHTESPTHCCSVPTVIVSATAASSRSGVAAQSTIAAASVIISTAAPARTSVAVIVAPTTSATAVAAIVEATVAALCVSIKVVAAILLLPCSFRRWRDIAVDPRTLRVINMDIHTQQVVTDTIRNFEIPFAASRIALLQHVLDPLLIYGFAAVAAADVTTRLHGNCVRHAVLRPMRKARNPPCRGRDHHQWHEALHLFRFRSPLPDLAG